MKNPYTILGIPTDATEEAIKKSYRAIAKETHPDLNGGDTSKADRFNEATEAYDFLLDPEKRRAYDEELQAGDTEEADSMYEEYAEETPDAFDVEEYLRNMASQFTATRENFREGFRENRDDFKANARRNTALSPLLIVFGLLIVLTVYLQILSSSEKLFFTPSAPKESDLHIPIVSKLVLRHQIRKMSDDLYDMADTLNGYTEELENIGSHFALSDDDENYEAFNEMQRKYGAYYLEFDNKYRAYKAKLADYEEEYGEFPDDGILP